jgi:RNA polymerase sigma factor (sigma-70 family)
LAIGGLLLLKTMTESGQLLVEFVERGSEEAFRQLVARYVDLVYSTALRLVGGDNHCAEDVAQTVFLHLSRQAPGLPADTMLGGWLHRDTCYVARNVLRSERRRRAREQEFALMESTPDHSQATLAGVAPFLDEAIDTLTQEDRADILLRFYERLDFHRLGAVLGSSEDAARMRVSRALDKLQLALTKRGVALSTAALAGGLTTEAVTAAPAGLAAAIGATTLATSAAVGGAVATTIKLIAMTKTQAAVLAALVLGAAAVPMWVQHRNQTRMLEENRGLHEQMQQLASQNEQLSNQVTQAAATPAAEAAQERELLKLRNQVSGLKRDLADAQAKAKAQAARNVIAQQHTDEAEKSKEVSIAKLNYSRNWMLAFLNYAQQHTGQSPTNFEAAASFAPEGLTNGFNLTPDQFEIVYNGALDPNNVTNPQSLIVIREKQAWQTPDGGWVRAYSFADGHSEIHKAVDGNFEPWEAQRMTPPPTAPSGQ